MARQFHLRFFLTASFQISLVDAAAHLGTLATLLNHEADNLKAMAVTLKSQEEDSGPEYRDEMEELAAIQAVGMGTSMLKMAGDALSSRVGEGSLRGRTGSLAESVEWQAQQASEPSTEMKTYVYLAARISATGVEASLLLLIILLPDLSCCAANEDDALAESYDSYDKCADTRTGSSCSGTRSRRHWPHAQPLKEAHLHEALEPVPKGWSKAKASILQQEMLELELLSELYQQRLSILEDLQKGLQMGLGRHLPSSNVRALQQSMPPLSEQVILGVPPAAVTDEDYSDEVGESAAGSTSTATAIDDFLVSKAVIPQEPPATHIGLMPLRNHRSSAPAPTSQVAMPTVLLVVVQADGDICLYTASGDLALAFRSGHKQAIVQMAVSPMQDEYVVATVDSAGVMRVHRLFVRPRRGPQEQRRRVTNPDEEKVSNHLGSPANITVQFNLATRVPLIDGNLNQSSQPHLTAFIMTSTQGVKYFVAGDSVGWISVFTRNGTLHGRIRVSNSLPVAGISAHLGNVVYVAGHQWGFIDLEKATARNFICHKYETSLVHAAVTDTALQSRVIAADQDGTLWVFATRDKRDCKVEHRFPRGAARTPLSLSSVRGFALALEASRTFSGRSEMIAFNMSHVGKGWDDSARDMSPIAWRKSSRPVRDWAVQRRYQEGDLLAMLSQDGTEIEIFELMMQVYQPPPGDLLGNFKLPVFAAAMILVMGYQFVKQKGPFDPGAAEGDG